MGMTIEKIQEKLREALALMADVETTGIGLSEEIDTLTEMDNRLGQRATSTRNRVRPIAIGDKVRVARYPGGYSERTLEKVGRAWITLDGRMFDRERGGLKNYSQVHIHEDDLHRINHHLIR